MGKRKQMKLHKLPKDSCDQGSDNGGNERRRKQKSLDFQENRQNHDFLYILFPVLTGDSGFIMTA
jgi:hypothetical protein